MTKNIPKPLWQIKQNKTNARTQALIPHPVVCTTFSSSETQLKDTHTHMHPTPSLKSFMFLRRKGGKDSTKPANFYVVNAFSGGSVTGWRMRCRSVLVQEAFRTSHRVGMSFFCFFVMFCGCRRARYNTAHCWRARYNTACSLQGLWVRRTSRLVNITGGG